MGGFQSNAFQDNAFQLYPATSTVGSYLTAIGEYIICFRRRKRLR